MNVVEEKIYDILQNANGEILLVISAKEKKPVNARFSYAGGNEAILLHSTQILYLKGIHSEVQPALAAANKILVVEVDGKNVVREYEAPVGMISEKGLHFFTKKAKREETIERTVEGFTQAIELHDRDVQLLGDTLHQRALAYFHTQNYKAAILDIQRVVALSKGRNEKAVEDKKNISETIVNGCHGGIDPQSPDFDISLVPYFFLIKTIKENPDKTIKEVVGIEEINNIAAALAAFEEYGLLERYVAEGNSLNLHTEDWAFRSWQPTPFFYANCWKIYGNLKDSERLLRFLVEKGADPDMTSADGMTPLYNATFSLEPIGKLRLLLSLGCDPNKESADDELSWYPLSHCLVATEDENEEIHAPSKESIQKARILLEYGADPNKGIEDLPPLVQAILACDHSDIDLIKDLLERGADPNVLCNGDSLTPLLASYDQQWFEAGQLLLLYGVDMEATQKLVEKRNKQEKERKKMQDKVALLLEGIDKELVEDFYRFSTDTALGKSMTDANLFYESLYFWFGIFALPFKDQLYGHRFEYMLDKVIYPLDFSHTPEELLETTYGYNKLLSAVFATFYRTQFEDEERYSFQKMLDLYTEAEEACRRSMYDFGDAAFINVAACRYLQGKLYMEHGMEEECSLAKKECQSTYFNLSQREDLFDNTQRAVLSMLQKLMDKLLQRSEINKKYCISVSVWEDIKKLSEECFPINSETGHKEVNGSFSFEYVFIEKETVRIDASYLNICDCTWKNASITITTEKGNNIWGGHNTMYSFSLKEVSK